MTPAEKILKMIEEVDPEDSDTLDEIDARFWCWKHDLELLPNLDNHGFYFFMPESESTGWKELIKYTRSRDALKAERPEDWTYSSHQNRKGFEYPKPGWVVSLGSVCRSPILPTEYLAELHAIVQAKEWKYDNA